MAPFSSLLSLLLLLLIMTPASAAGTNRDILLLHSYHAGMKWTDDVTKGIADVLQPEKRGLSLHIEYMDTKKITFDADYEKHLYAVLEHKYAKVKPDLIFVSDNNAFDFIRRHRNGPFSGVPVVFCGVNFFRDEQLAGQKNITGVAEVFDAAGTLEFARVLHPELKAVYVINDHLPTGKVWTEETKAQLKGLFGKLNIRYADDLPMNQLLEEVGKLPEESIVLLGVYFRDGSGKYFAAEESTQLISEGSPVPVYGLLDFTLGHGIVGGNLINGHAQGEAAARLGVRILAGEEADNIPVLKEGPNVPMFDLVQLNRFAIGEDKLPVGRQTINRKLVTFTPEELRWIDEHPVVRLAPDPTFQPFEFFDKRGEFKGIAADYIALLEKKIGIRFETVQLKDWSEVLKQIRGGRVDLISAVNETAQRTGFLNFSEPYLRYPFVIVARQGIQQRLDLGKLEGKRVAVVNRYAIHDFLERDHPELKLIPVANYSEGLRGVAFGDYGVFIANLASVSYFIEQEGITNLHVAGESGYFSNLAISVRKGLPGLMPILNKGLNLITVQERSEINSRWIRLGGAEVAWWQLSREQIIALLSALAGMIVMAIIFWNIQLRHKVSMRTKQLQEAVGKLDSAMKEQALILRNAQVGIAHVVDRKLHWINPKMAEQRGMQEEELLGQDTRIFYLSDEDYSRVGLAYSTSLAEGSRFETEVHFRRGKDDSYWCRLAGQAVDPAQASKGSIWLLQDITAQKELEHYLTEKATMDYLTGVNNRRHFSDLANQEIKRSHRSHRFLSLLMLDIDHFKRINDDYGHATGDEALRSFTKTVQSMLREHDILGRFGGEEFAVLLPESDREAAMHVAERIRQAIAEGGFEAGGERIGFTVTIGLISLRGGERDLEAMLAAADKALYEGKNSGRNRVIFHTI